MKKLILIGSGAFEEQYSQTIMKTRFLRLSEEEREEVRQLMAAMDDPTVRDKDILLAKLGELISKADTYKPLPHKKEVLACHFDMYENIWRQASELRRRGTLLELGRNIQCPVVAIHGDYDPHDYRGVKIPLSHVLTDFRFILLKNCGHQPWIEQEARVPFFTLLRRELQE